MSEQAWSYYNPTPTHYGLPQVATVLRDLEPKGVRVALVTGETAAQKHGWVRNLGAKLTDLTIDHLPLVPPEPSESDVDILRLQLRHVGPGAIIALGGGSTIDAAKIAAATFDTDLSLDDLMGRRTAVPSRSVPLIAIPTTYGSGSEVTPFAVLSDNSGLKRSLPSPRLFPDAAVLEPGFASSLPPKVIADGGLDALAHALEACWSIRCNPVSEALAIKAATLVVLNLQRLYERPSDSEAARQMALASNLAGYAFSNTLTAACHAISYPLSARFGLSHGAACAVTLDRVAEINSRLPEVSSKLSELGSRLGMKGREVVLQIRALRDAVAPGSRPETLGLEARDVEFVRENAFVPLMQNNPVEIGEDDLRRVLGVAPN